MANNSCFVIVCQNINVDLKQWKDQQFIGVETGAIKLLADKLPIVLACADFDHTSEAQLNLIKSQVTNVHILPKEKDILDSEYAILQAIKMKAKKIVLIATGKRWGMLYGLISLLIKYQKYGLTIYDENNILLFVNKTVVIEKRDYLGYKYVDFLPLVKTRMDLKGFKYPLTNNKILLPFDNYFISNEISQEQAIITLKEGYGILTISKTNNK